LARTERSVPNVKSLRGEGPGKETEALETVEAHGYGSGTGGSQTAAEPLLSVRNLQTDFLLKEGTIRAVDNVSFSVSRNETLGIVGESGSGKTTLALSIAGLVREPGRVVRGEVIFEGTDLRTKTTREVEQIRGNQIGFIFQSPSTFFNPVFTIGQQLADVLILHKGLSREEALEIVTRRLADVHIDLPTERLSSYPHQLSGGMVQRAFLAMSILCEPKLLIADEPTTSLDVILQDEFLELLKELQKKTRMSVLLISHDLSLIAETCDKVAVMYAGKLVEYGSVYDVYDNPAHPYTKALLRSIPDFRQKSRQLSTIGGSVPDLLNLPKGCNFWPRCSYAKEKCHTEGPRLENLGNGHFVLCWYPLQGAT